MSTDLDYNTISNLVESWDSVKGIDNFEETIGSLMLEKLCRIEPEVLVIFGFPRDVNPKSLEDLKMSPRLLQHARHIVRMMDSALAMIGPDIDTMTDLLVKQGLKHAQYGVQAWHYECMGMAWIETLQETLDQRFTIQIRFDWEEFYNAISSDMMEAQSLSSSASSLGDDSFENGWFLDTHHEACYNRLGELSFAR